MFLKLLRNLEFVFIGELFLSNVTCLSEDFQVVRIETIVALEKQILFLFNIYLSFEKFREKDETTIGLEFAEKLRQLSC